MKQKKVLTTSDKIAEKQKKRSLRPYKIVSVLSAALFVWLAVYMVYFQVVKSDSLLNSPYNKRTDALSEKVVRGMIKSSDGQILARTDVDGNGGETRVYPYGSLFAHTVGYLEYGSSGLELSENSRLLSSHVDITSQVKQDFRDEKKPGDTVVTTLDAGMQQTASEALGDYRGAVFAMETETGSVLVDVSRPSYDPNTIVQDWSDLTSEENESSGIFMNRALQGLYPPGSTFKMVTALAYLRSYASVDDFSYECTGSYEHAGYTIHCNEGAAHGKESFEDAMANSCNCAFAYMATELIDRQVLINTADNLGFNKKQDLQLPSSKSRFTLEKDSADQLTMQTGIGQGETVATPMEICMIADAIANGGKMMAPKFVDRVENANGSVVKTISGKSIGNVMTSEEADTLTGAMRAVVERGTGKSLADLPWDIAGKTGTAQYGDVSEGKSHSWFVGFSNTGENDIVVCVLVENGGGGNKSAYKVAREIFESYFEDR